MAIDLNKKRESQIDTTWDDVFKMIFEVTKKQIHCSTLAYYKSIVQPYDDSKGYGIASFIPLPANTAQEDSLIRAYFFNREDFKEDEVYGIIFTDYNFKSSISMKKQQTVSDDSEKHSISYGVVIKLM